VGDKGAGKVGVAFPVVVSTWPFREAVRAAWKVVSTGEGWGSAVDAVVAGCSACEDLRCDGTGQYLLACSLARVVLHMSKSKAELGWQWPCCPLKHIVDAAALSHWLET
jgi:hypothetical protein